MLRLFISIDMVGSTQFKAQCESSRDWLETFRIFVEHLPLFLESQIGAAFAERERMPEVDIWKVMGDEIIFATRPDSLEEISTVLHSVLKSMGIFEERYYQNLPLRLKGAAWLADFGKDNIEIEIPDLSSKDGQAHIDFIGPDLDLGFRVTKFARPSLLALSLDLAELLVDCDAAQWIQLFWVGSEPLKGVMYGRPYPMIWMPDPEVGFNFMPWELDDCRFSALAAKMPPTPHSELTRIANEMRSYLAKMHGVDRPKFSVTT
ncbi:MAG: hypothetical protein AAFP79_09315 [Pseudomonadota bacterium]